MEACILQSVLDSLQSDVLDLLDVLQTLLVNLAALFIDHEMMRRLQASETSPEESIQREYHRPRHRRNILGCSDRLSIRRLLLQPLKLECEKNKIFENLHVVGEIFGVVEEQLYFCLLVCLNSRSSRSRDSLVNKGQIMQGVGC